MSKHVPKVHMLDELRLSGPHSVLHLDVPLCARNVRRPQRIRARQTLTNSADRVTCKQCRSLIERRKAI